MRWQEGRRSVAEDWSVKKMENVLAEAQARPPLRKVSLEAIKAVWDGLSSHLAETLRSGKGMATDIGTFGYHMDYVDLGNQKKTQLTAVFELSEAFARHFHLRRRKQPAGLSSQIPVRKLNVMAISSKSAQPHETVRQVLKQLFIHAGEAGMCGNSIVLDFHGVGKFTCVGGACAFTFAAPLASPKTLLFRDNPREGVQPPAASSYAGSARARTAPHLQCYIPGDERTGANWVNLPRAQHGVLTTLKSRSYRMHSGTAPHSVDTIVPASPRLKGVPRVMAAQPRQTAVTLRAQSSQTGACAEPKSVRAK